MDDEDGATVSQPPGKVHAPDRERRGFPRQAVCRTATLSNVQWTDDPKLVTCQSCTTQRKEPTVALWYVTFPQRFADADEEHPTLPTAHPHGYVEVDAPDETKARKRASQMLGFNWSVLYPAADFDQSYYPRGCLAVIRKVDGEVKMETLTEVVA